MPFVNHFIYLSLNPKKFFNFASGKILINHFKSIWLNLKTKSIKIA